MELGHHMESTSQYLISTDNNSPSASPSLTTIKSLEGKTER